MYSHKGIVKQLCTYMDMADNVWPFFIFLIIIRRAETSELSLLFYHKFQITKLIYKIPYSLFFNNLTKSLILKFLAYVYIYIWILTYFVTIENLLDHEICLM